MRLNEKIKLNLVYGYVLKNVAYPMYAKNHGIYWLENMVTQIRVYYITEEKFPIFGIILPQKKYVIKKFTKNDLV